MSRMTRKLPLTTPQMYRHFAAVTLAVTGLLAMFAQGEQQKVAVAAPAVPAGPDAIDQATHGAPVGLIASRASASSTGGAFMEVDADDTWARDRGRGGETSGDLAGMVVIPAPAAAAVSGPAVLSTPPPGMTKEEWGALLARKRRGVQPEETSAKEMEALLAASRERSGASDGRPD